MTSRRPLRIASIAAAAVIVVAAGAAIATALFDPNAYKPEIVQAVRLATGRDLTLNGPLRLKLSLWPTIQASDVGFSNPPGFSRPQMASVQGLEAELSLLPLLSGQIAVARLVLIHPDILLETNAAGRANWPLTPDNTQAATRAQAAPAPVRQTGGNGPRFTIASVGIQDGTLAYRDDRTGRTAAVALTKLDAAAASPDAPIHIAMEAAHDGTAFGLTADTASLTEFTSAPATAPWPLKAVLTAGAATLRADGSLGRPADGKGYTLTLAAAVADATLSAKGTIQDIGALKGADIAIGVDAPNLAALSPLAGRPLPPIQQTTFHGVLTGDLLSTVALHGFSLTGSGSDLAGDATFARGVRPTVTATLASKRIDLDALRAAIGQTSAPTRPASANGTNPPSPATAGADLFPRQPLPWALLRATDANVTLTIADLHTGGADYTAIHARAVVENGKLNVAPFAAGLPGGGLNGTLSADAAQPAPPVHLTLHAPGLALKALLAAAREPAYADGNLEVYADLTGAGQSPHDIAASLDGSLGLAVAGGTIDTSLFGNLMTALNAAGKTGQGELKCFALRMRARDGIGTIQPLALGSALLTMTGSGTINLRDETLSMGLEPQGRVAGTGFTIPLTVSGPIRQPAIRISRDATTPLGIVAGLLGGDKPFGGASTDICTPALAAARGQAVPEPGAAPAAPGANKPEDILKNLFR